MGGCWWSWQWCVLGDDDNAAVAFNFRLRQVCCFTFSLSRLFPPFTDARGLPLELFTQVNVPRADVVQLYQGAGASDEFPTSHQCVYFDITWEVRPQQIQSIHEGARRVLQFPNEQGHVAHRLLLLLHLELWPKSLQSMTAAVTAQDVH